MRRKLTITIDEDVYKGLYKHIGRRNISRFIESLVRPHVIEADLDEAYRLMAEDEAREADALEWSENLIGDSYVEEYATMLLIATPFFWIRILVASGSPALMKLKI